MADFFLTFSKQLLFTSTKTKDAQRSQLLQSFQEAGGSSDQLQHTDDNGGEQSWNTASRKLSHTECHATSTRKASRGFQFQEAATPPVPAPCGGSVIGGRNMAFSFPDMFAISGSWDS